MGEARHQAALQAAYRYHQSRLRFNLLVKLPAPSCFRANCIARAMCVRHVNMTISLAFLAPKLVCAAVEGRLPRGISIERLRDAPAEWSRQFEVLGLNPQQ